MELKLHNITACIQRIICLLKLRGNILHLNGNFNTLFETQKFCLFVEVALFFYSEYAQHHDILYGTIM